MTYSQYLFEIGDLSILPFLVPQVFVPDDLNSARVVPHFNKKYHLSVGYYRHVSIVYDVTSILEIVVLYQSDSYIKGKKDVWFHQKQKW